MSIRLERFLWTQKEDERGPLSVQSSLFRALYSEYELQLIDGLQEQGVLIHEGEVYQDVIIAQEEGEGSNNCNCG
jgi:hypothetical protein